jgi:hypothetical protein
MNLLKSIEITSKKLALDVRIQLLLQKIDPNNSSNVEIEKTCKKLNSSFETAKQLNQIESPIFAYIPIRKYKSVLSNSFYQVD